MTRQEFVSIARVNGIIGAPMQDFEENLAFILDSSIIIEIEGAVGDVVARAYWDDSAGNGGCISIPGDDLLKAV